MYTAFYIQTLVIAYALNFPFTTANYTSTSNLILASLYRGPPQGLACSNLNNNAHIEWYFYPLTASDHNPIIYQVTNAVGKQEVSVKDFYKRY